MLQERQAKRRRLLSMLGAAAGFAMIAVVVLILVNRDDVGGYENEPVTRPPAGVANLPREGRTVGDPDAPVHVIEYGDFQCPGCAGWAQQVKPELIANHVATGEVFFEYRDLTGLGSESRSATIAAACALEQDKFWEFHDMLYYNLVGRDEGGFANQRLIRMAEMLDMDVDRFEDCLDSDRFDADIADMQNSAANDGVRATPTLIVNGVPLVGPSYAQLRQQIEIALQEAGS